MINVILWIGFAIYFLVYAIADAKKEVAEEGPDGYGKNFPCKKWHPKGILNKLTGERPYFSEYHLWMVISLILGLHLMMWGLVFFSQGLTLWTLLEGELFVWGTWFIFLVAEDFFWFVLNPNYRLKKFKPEYVWWHVKWIWKTPDFYWYFVPLGIGLIILSQIL